MKRTLSVIGVWAAALILPHVIGYSYSELTGERVDPVMGAFMFWMSSMGAIVASIYIITELD